MAATIMVSSLSISFTASAADLNQIKSEITAQVTELPCDSQWKHFNGNADSVRDFYRITVSATGKLNLKIQADAFLEATLTNAEFTREYFTAYVIPSEGTGAVIRNQVLPAGSYYLSVKCAGKYSINATFGGNCYENPQELEPETEVKGSSTETESGWWYKINIPQDGLYVFFATAYGNADFRIYNNDLSVIEDSIALAGSSNAPANQRKNVDLFKGTYYICVNSDSTYKLSWERLTKDNCKHTFVHQYIRATYTSKGYQLNVCNTCGYKYKNNYSAVKKLSTPTVQSVKKGSKRITVNFSRSFYATGYQIQYSTSKKFKGKSVKKVSTKNLSKTIKSLKGRTKYYVRVRAYKKIDGKTVYSSWSEISSVTTKK